MLIFYLNSLMCAEDVFTGLELAAGLNWRAEGPRLLVHIADAPCHGREFYSSDISDHYPDGDKLGRSLPSLLSKLRKDLRIQVRNYFQ